MSDELDLRTEEEVTGTAEPEIREIGKRRDSFPSEAKGVKADKSKANQPPFTKGIVREYFESAVVTLIMALFGMTFIVQAVKVPTGSMKNTIWIQDHLLVNKFIFGPHNRLKVPILPERDIRRGDVVVFKYPLDPQTNYVKRVIGLPGETLEYDGRTDRLYVNGQELPEHR